MSTYRLKLSLSKPFYAIAHIHRIVDVRGDVLLSMLGNKTEELFGLNNNNQANWQFFISHVKSDNVGALMQIASVVDKHNDKSIDELQLKEKEYFYFYQTYPLKANHSEEKEILYRIRIEKLTQHELDSDLVLIKSLGELSQNEIESIIPNNQIAQDKTNLPDNINISPEMDFELSLISAVMLIAGDVQNPTRWQDLVEMGLADELVKRNLIKPCVSPTHKVRLTAYGESEMVRFMERAGMIKDQK